MVYKSTRGGGGGVQVGPRSINFIIANFDAFAIAGSIQIGIKMIYL